MMAMRWSLRKRVWVPLAAVGTVLVVGQFLVLPWLVRKQVESSLRALGLGDVTFHVTRATLWGSTLSEIQSGNDAIEQVRVDYSLRDLWLRRIDQITVRGARLTIRGEHGRIEFGS